MDYKKLVENLKEWHRTICKMCGDDILTCDDLCGCTGDCIVVQAITAITDFLTENQALRNAANGFKKQFEAAESRAEKAERERDTAVNKLPHVCETCVYYKVFFNGCTPDHDCTNPDGGCSNNYDRWAWDRKGE